MNQTSSWMELAVACIPMFANDGTLDEAEVEILLGIALRDGVIDADERRVLGRIFDRVTEASTSARVWSRISEIRHAYAI